MVHPISSSWTRVLPALVFLIIAAISPAAAQEGVEDAVVYEREVFEYPGGTRPDPFRSGMRTGDVGLRLEDLSLRGIVHHTDSARSVAFVMIAGSDRRIQAKVGQSVGTVRFLAIHPDHVE